ncbi:MAG: PRC-barrel domain containing protein [Hyphomicrobiales bacterium]|nr:PRC-barrel domain containing protein [Hyphomicrobiales bacterium]
MWSRAMSRFCANEKTRNGRGSRCGFDMLEQVREGVEHPPLQNRNAVFLIMVPGARRRPDHGTARWDGTFHGLYVIKEDEMQTTTSQRETHTLIGSDKVEGTSVRRPNGDKIGEIERIMIDKRSGKVAFAVMSFGGFLGMGEDYYPVPWNKLTYNVALDAYELDISDDLLQGAPSYKAGTDYDWSQEGGGKRVYDFYGAQPYWTF